jgi:hypothetical protein
LVSLNYSRKENDLASVNSLNWFDLDPELKDVINSFPIRYVAFNVDLMDIEDLDREQQFYVFISDGKVYLVDTQGYNYPRYIVELEGFDGEDDKFEMMESLVRINDSKMFDLVAKSLAFELQQEGFDREDILNYLELKLAKAFGSAE